MRKLEITITGAIAEGKSVLSRIIENAIREHGGDAVLVGSADFVKCENRIIQQMKRHGQPLIPNRDDLEPFVVTITHTDAVTIPEEPQPLVYRHGDRITVQESSRRG